MKANPFLGQRSEVKGGHHSGQGQSRANVRHTRVE